MSFLTLVPIYFSDHKALLGPMAVRLERVFLFPVRIRHPWFDPELSFDSSRGQYNSTVLLGQLLSEPSGGAPRVLGVTSVDLFIPILTYVFGEAQLDGRAALVSTHRLQNELYGLPSDPQLLLERLLKEAVHELGHTFGLIHCPASDCVMHASTYVEEIDLKSADFCTACLRLLRARQPSVE